MTPGIVGTYLSVFEVNLVSQHNEGEVLRIPGTGLDEEFVSPAVEGFERVGGSHVKHQHAAVCASVEGHTQRLEPLLSGRVPDLRERERSFLGAECQEWGVWRTPGAPPETITSGLIRNRIQHPSVQSTPTDSSVSGRVPCVWRMLEKR